MGNLQKSTTYFRDRFMPFEMANLSIASAPVLYGLATYTVFPVFWNKKEKKAYIFRLPDHFNRLVNSCKIIALDGWALEWDYEKFQQMICELLQKNKIQVDSLVRVSIFVDDLLKGTRMHDLKNSISAFVYEAVPLAPIDGAHLCVSSWRRTPDNAIPSRAKINGSYVNVALMKHEALVNGFDDAIALDEQGHVTESTVANIFIVRDNQLLTPGITTDLMEGITRDTVFHLADHLNIAYKERNIDRSELYIADEIFICGSSMSITPVLSVDHRTVSLGKIGKITKQLVTAYGDSCHHRNELFANWLTPVAHI
jgi:branched-chain amino acid aminotransferase